MNFIHANTEMTIVGNTIENCRVFDPLRKRTAIDYLIDDHTKWMVRESEVSDEPEFSGARKICREAIWMINEQLNKELGNTSGIYYLP
jgi:hypothetical protein